MPDIWHIPSSNVSKRYPFTCPKRYPVYMIENDTGSQFTCPNRHTTLENWYFCYQSGYSKNALIG